MKSLEFEKETGYVKKAIKSPKSQVSSNNYQVEQATRSGSQKVIHQYLRKKKNPKINSFPGGTLSMIKFQSTSDMFGKLQFGDKKDMPEDAKMKLKWKTIQFLLENKKQ